MRTEWIKTTDRLPPNALRCLAVCIIDKEEDRTWEGIIDVVFYVTSGWQRCEDKKRDVVVLYWANFPERPIDLKDY